MKIIIYLTAIPLLLITGCATPPTEPLPAGPKGEAITALIDTLQDDSSPTVRAAAAISLGKLKCRYADTALIKAMRYDQNLNVKRATIKALGMMGGPKAIPALNAYRNHAPTGELQQYIDSAVDIVEKQEN